MKSPEQEIVAFTKHINVVEGEKKGNVEIWLNEIEAEMRSSLKNISITALNDDMPRTDWIINYPAMIVLMGNIVRWTQDSEQSIAKSDSKSL